MSSSKINGRKSTKENNCGCFELTFSHVNSWKKTSHNCKLYRKFYQHQYSYDILMSGHEAISLVEKGWSSSNLSSHLHQTCLGYLARGGLSSHIRVIAPEQREASERKLYG